MDQPVEGSSQKGSGDSEVIDLDMKLKEMLVNSSVKKECVIRKDTVTTILSAEEMEEILIEAKHAYAHERYGVAINMFTEIIEKNPKNVDLLSNRAQAYLNLGCYKSAFKDTRKALKINPQHQRTLFKHVKSLWGLGEYQESMAFLTQKVPVDILAKPDFIYLLERAPKLLEQSKGNYDAFDVINLPKQGQGRVDMAEYKGPVEISEIPRKGRGLIATQDITPGTILICSKAFAIATDRSKEVCKDCKTRHTGQVELHNQLVIEIMSKLDFEPDLWEEFYELYSGPPSDTSDLEKCKAEDKYADEIFEGVYGQMQLTDVLTDEVVQHKKRQIKEINKRIFYNFYQTPSFGIWILPAYLNHSCVDANSYWMAYKDFMIVRTVRDIKAGEEITICYAFPGKTVVADVARSVCDFIFEDQRFTCDCRLCQHNRTANAQDALNRELDIKKAILKKSNRTDPKTLQGQVKLVRQILKLRDPTLSLGLMDACIVELGLQLMMASQWELAAEVCEIFWTLCANVPFLAEQTVTYSATLVSFNIQMGKMDEAEKWACTLVNRDLIVAFGSEVKTWGWDKFQRLLSHGSGTKGITTERNREITRLLIKNRFRTNLD